MNAWLLLGAAIATELVATSALKASDGLSRLVPSAIVVVGYVLSFYLVAIVLRTLPLGMVYAIWSGIGTVGMAFIGMLVWQESLSLVKGTGIALVVAGVVLLNLSGTSR